MRSSRLAIAALLMLLAGFPARGDRDLNFEKLQVAKSATTSGDRLLRQGRFVRAEDRFRDAIAAAEEYPPAYLGLGSALVGQGRFDEAVEVLRQAERRYVDWQDLLQGAKMRHRGITLDKQLATEDLLIQAKAIAVLANAAVQPAVLRVIQHLSAESIRLEGARERGEQIDPGVIAAIPAQVFYLEGISHLRRGQREAGVETLQVALLLDPEHALASYNLAVALFVGGRVREAKQHLDAALAGGIEPPEQFLDDVERALAAAGAGPAGP